MGAKKLGMLPAETFLNDAIRDGRAVEKELSMRAIGTPDVRLQQRVLHLDVDHVYRLDQIRIARGHLESIVVFEEQKPHRFHVADGHHRHEVYRIAKEKSIRAWVIQGTWRDAMIYSTMCNQGMNLPRKPEDIKKAVFTLVADKEWFKKSAYAIGNHVGCSNHAAERYKREFAAQQGLDLPEEIESRNGRVIPRTKWTSGKPKLRKKSGSSFEARLGGELVNLGADKAEAEKKIDDHVAELKDKRRVLEASDLTTYFSRRGLVFRSTNLNNNWGLGRCRMGHSVVWVPIEYRSQFGSSESPVAPNAHGQVRLARQLLNPLARAVVICYPEDIPSELLAASRADGVEYLTPDELVASLKGTTP